MSWTKIARPNPKKPSKDEIMRALKDVQEYGEASDIDTEDYLSAFGYIEFDSSTNRWYLSPKGKQYYWKR